MSSNQMVPINPDKKDDIYERYKMPAVQTKIEGNGNGIKTVIPNIHEICIAINRPEEVLMKYFQFTLGAQRTVNAKDDKFLLMGSHTTERMQERVYDFIRQTVLCKHCSNPETTIELDTSKKASKTYLSCGACGKTTHFQDGRIFSFMAQYYEKHPEEAKRAKGAAEARKKEHEQAAAAEGAKLDAPGGKKPKSSKTVVKSDLADDRDDPAKVFTQHYKECGEHPEEMINRMVRLMIQHNLTDTQGPRLLLAGLVSSEPADLLACIQKNIILFRRFCTVDELFERNNTVDESKLTSLLIQEKKIQCSMLDAFASHFRNKNADQFPVTVFLLFVESVLKDTSIAEWAKEVKADDNTEGKDKDKYAELRKMLAPIVEWLGVSRSAEQSPVEQPVAPVLAA